MAASCWTFPTPRYPTPTRFLPHSDNALLSHADRVRIIGDQDRERIIAGGTGSVGTVLVDGFVGGTWRMERAHDKVTLLIEPFETPPKGHRDAVVEEGGRLARFMAGTGEAEARVIEPTWGTTGQFVRPQ